MRNWMFGFVLAVLVTFSISPSTEAGPIRRLFSGRVQCGQFRSVGCCGQSQGVNNNFYPTPSQVQYYNQQQGCSNGSCGVVQGQYQTQGFGFVRQAGRIVVNNLSCSGGNCQVR